MKPNSKENKTELVTCQFCDWTFSKKFAAKHKQFCNNSEGDTEKFSINQKLCHGFVKNGILFATTDEPTSVIAEELNQINVCWVKENICFVNPTVMKICRMKLGDAVSISGSKETFLGVVWPSANVQMCSVFIPKRSSLHSLLKNEKILRIERSQKIYSAENLVLTPTVTKTFTNSEDFLQFTKNFLKNAFVCQNADVYVHYFGHVCVLRCSNLCPKENDSVTNLVLNLSNLSMTNFADSDVGDISFNSIRENSSFLNESASSKCSNVDEADVNYVLLPSKPSNFEFIYQISEKTSISILTNSSADGAVSLKNTSRFDDLGGLKLAKQILTDRILIPMKLFKNNSRFSLKNSKSRSILLYGPSGCGKSKLANALANEGNLNLIVFDPNNSFVDSKTGKINVDETPCILFLDDIDAHVYVKETSAATETTKKSLNSVCSLIDSIQNDDRLIFFVAATNKPDRLDNFLRRRFDLELEISIPNRIERLEILNKILVNFDHCLSIGDVERVAESAHGFTSSDLSILCKEAGVRSTKRFYEKSADANEHQLDADADALVNRIDADDLIAALTTVRPSGMREIFLDVPKVLWSEIGGQQQLKLQLKQAIEWPLKNPEAFFRLGIKPPSGILMYGPPGCSKTMVAKALATESGLNFLAIKGPELFSKWVGESERAVREVFRKARQVAPSIIFFDEIDALGAERNAAGGSNVADRVLTQLLTELDGVQTLLNVVVVAATNRPDVIDRALLRPGRLDRMVYVPLPDDATREDILKIQFRKIPIADDVDVKQLIARTEGFSGAEIVILCTEAALLALQENLDANRVKMEHFEKSLIFVKPRTDTKNLKVYEQFFNASNC